MAVFSSLSLASNSYALHSFSRGQSQKPEAQGQSINALSNVHDKALESLAREIPGMEVSDLARLDPAEYTPDKIAERISSAVARGLESARAQGKSEAEVQSLYESALKGVEQGFAEAKDILANLDMLDGSIAEQVRATEEATFDALAGLSPARKEQDLSAVRTLSAAARYESAQDFDLTLKTKEGDTLRVSFSKDLSAQAGYAVAEDADGNRGAVLDVSRTEASGYSFRIEGDLSVDEIDAIQSLIQDVGRVANDFFGGDAQKAFEQLPDISFDNAQLASMDLHMARTEQYSAVQRYQETQHIDNPGRQRQGLRLGNLMHDFGESFRRPGLERFGEVDRFASSILKGLVEQDTRYKDASAERQSAYQSNLRRMLPQVQNANGSTL